MTKVTLHGALGQAIGENWEFELRQPREAVAAIEANTGKLYAYLRTHTDAEYRVIINGQDHGSVEELYLVGEFTTIDIVPVPAGSAGLWQVLLGVVLIIVGIVIIVATGGIGAPAVIGIAGFFQAAAPFIIGAGLSMALSGVAQMLAPSPKLGTSPLARTFASTADQMATDKKDKGTNSYLFSGAINTTSQANPVQIIYGEMITGSQTVSLAITSATVDAAVIGAQKSPPADDDFFDLPVWAALAADPKGDTVPTQRSVQVMRVRDIPAARDVFGLPDIFPDSDPAAGRTIQIGNSNMPRRTVRGYLSTVSYLFANKPKGISFAEAIDLYKLLELTSLADVSRATWKQVVIALANHFEP